MLYDSKRSPIQLGDNIGVGGEAIVYRVTNRPAQLAKIYNRIRANHEEKLLWMRDHSPDDPAVALGHASLAWPLDLLYNGKGQFVGYLMPFIRNAVIVFDVFNPRRRAQVLPNFNYRYLHRTAQNLATTLSALHARDYVIGDLNESNVMVTPQALVTIIDADSVQVDPEGPLVYPCPVGKPEYTPPELQGKPFENLVRTPLHDSFGLAILIFQLLLGGSHPYRARWLGAGDPPPIEERIRWGCFPYLKSPPCPVRPPPNVPGLNTLHPDLVTLMWRCFVDGYRDPSQRPTPDMWRRALAEAEHDLIVCERGHYYGRHLKECPECQVEQRRRRLAAYTPPPSVSRPPQPMSSLLGGLASPPTVPRPAAVSFANVRLCPICGQSNALTEIYCQHCAQQLTPNKLCLSCKVAIPIGARYCTQCGRQQ